ncbi:MAG: AEC family transporter [Myxococcales bacterium]|nr:AEC family transporter [Myxococcales bacterium]
MDSLLVVFASFVAGVLLRRSPRAPKDAHRALNAFVLDVALPAVVLRAVPRLAFDLSVVGAALMPWIVFALAGALLWPLGRALGWSTRTRGALILTAGLGNTSFVGFPMVEALMGPEHLPVAVVVDQLGSFFVLSLPGIALAFAWSGGAASPPELLRRIVRFPPFVALVAGLVLHPFGLPEVVDQALGRIGSTLTPLAMASVGFQLQLGELRKRAGALSIGLAYKLVLAPLAIALVYVPIFGLTDATRVIVLEAAMAPMVSAGIVAQERDLDPEIVTLMLGVGIPLSFFTVTIAAYLMGVPAFAP